MPVSCRAESRQGPWRTHDSESLRQSFSGSAIGHCYFIAGLYYPFEERGYLNATRAAEARVIVVGLA
jgi:hypothetical protein